MHSGYEDDEFCTVDRAQPNFLQRKTQKSSNTVRCGELELVRLSSIDSVKTILFFPLCQRHQPFQDIA